MNFVHLKCQVCEKHFCCVSHRIDHENKNHTKPTLPEVKQPLKIKLYQQKRTLINALPLQIAVTNSFKSKIVIQNSDQIQYRTSLNKFGVATSSLIYLQEIKNQDYIKMSDFIERPLQVCPGPDDANTSQTIVRLYSAITPCGNECQISNNIQSNAQLSTAQKIIKVTDVQTAVTTTIHFNIRKRSYDSQFREDKNVVKKLSLSPGYDKRKILLPVHRNKFKSKIDRSVNIFEIKDEEIQNNFHTLSNICTTSSNLVSPVNENDPGKLLKTSTPIMNDTGQLELPQDVDKIDTDTNSGEIKNETVNNYYSPAISEISATSSNLVVYVNENDSDISLKASTPITSKFESFDLPQDVDNNLCDSAISFYNTPFGEVTKQSTSSKGKAPFVVDTPLRGIISKAPKIKFDRSTVVSPKLQRVTFYLRDNRQSCSPLESVKEADFEEDSVTGTEELVVQNLSDGKCNELTNVERKGILNTVAGIVSSAIHRFPSLVKSSWQWGQEVQDIPTPSTGLKRLLTPDKQPDILSLSPVPKRLCYERDQLMSPIRGRKPLDSYCFNK